MTNIYSKNSLNKTDNDTSIIEITNRIEEFRNEILDNKNENTRRAYLADFTLYKSFCDEEDIPSFSTDKKQIEKSIKAYVKHMANHGYKPDTIRRKLSSISYFIEIAGIYNPIRGSKLFKEFVKNLMQNKKYRAVTRQATPFKISDLEEYNKREPSTLAEIRDKAIINLAFDTMLRASNIIELECADLDMAGNSVFVAFSKTDKTGKGSYRYVSDYTIEACKAWLKASGIKRGKLFRGVTNTGKVRQRGLSYSGLLNIMKSVGKSVGMEISCHSTRVGAAVSLYENEAHESDIMRQGGWKSIGMVMRYTEQARARKGGMIDLRKSASKPNDTGIK